MSGMALIWAANVKGLKSAAKIVLIQLADFHNKETGQCNPSAQRLADECEMGRATLFRHMTTLEECGLVRGTLDEQDAEPDGWIGRQRVGAHSIANSVRGCVARLVERGLELREAAHATRDQLEINESRRRDVEAELETRELEMDWGMTH